MKNSIYTQYIKRFFDILCALATMIVFCWLFAFLAVKVRLKLGKNVIFKQPRPGKNEKIFYLYKFRTMTDERDENGNLLPDEVRLTEFGKRLRATSLDELPEVLNILKGDMSVIGPRPQLVRDMVFMTEKQRVRHQIRPGLSGLAQTRGRNALMWDVKLATDLEYLQNISFFGDVKIIIDTVRQVFFRQNTGKEEIDITNDLGDFLLQEGRISLEEYKEKQQIAENLLKDFYNK